MSDPSNYELLSAYVDGELPAHERAHVERLLAADADCRKVYGELLALRASLADLPRHRLDEDLGPRVVRLAQESLGERQPAPGERVPAALQAADRRARRWRTIVYPLAVAAAAVVMLIAAPREKREQQMARAPRKDAPPAAVSAAPPPAAGPATARHFGAVQMDELSAPGATPAVEGDATSNFELETINRRAAGKAASSPKGERSPQFHVIDSDSDSDAMAADGPADTGETMSADEAKSLAGYQELRLNRNSYFAAPAANSPQPSLPAGAKPTLVLECTLAPAAIRDKAFDLLLARNHLAAVAAPAGAEAQSEDRRDRVADKIAEPAQEAGEILATQEKPLPLDKQKAKLGIVDGEKSPPRNVLVEMKAEQLVALLADLQNHPEQFLSVQLSGRPKADPGPTGAAVPLFAADSAGKLAEEPASDHASGAGTLNFTLSGAVAGSGPQPLVVLFRLSEGQGP